MGREIRRVALGWEPPKMFGCYMCCDADRCEGWHWHPHFDESLRHAQEVWDREAERWEREPRHDCTFVEWDGERPSDPAYYRPDWPEGTPLGYCYYETVSEGTPISPVFATEAELADWLVEHEGMSREGAWRFVSVGWAPTGILTSAGIVPGAQAVAEGRL